MLTLTEKIQFVMEKNLPVCPREYNSVIYDLSEAQTKFRKMVSEVGASIDEVEADFNTDTEALDMFNRFFDMFKMYYDMNNVSLPNLH